MADHGETIRRYYHGCNTADPKLVHGHMPPGTWTTYLCRMTKLLSNVLHGTEWFVFVDDRIKEVRSYHNNHRLTSPANRDLHGFPYADRGYYQLTGD